MIEFESRIVSLIHTFSETQESVLRQSAEHIARCITEGGRFFTVGTGHSHMVGEEFYARAGGLACTRLIAPMELTLGEHPMKSTHIERISAYADVMIAQYGIHAGDTVLISSNSGRNGMLVELALKLKKLGATTIAFTNRRHSESVASRHDSGKKLYELCDFVIDNCGEPGDASVPLEGVRGRMGASSSIIGMYMAQTLSMYIAEALVELGAEVPVFLSSNLDAGDAWNDGLMKKYYNL